MLGQNSELALFMAVAPGRCKEVIWILEGKAFTIVRAEGKSSLLSLFLSMTLPHGRSVSFSLCLRLYYSLRVSFPVSTFVSVSVTPDMENMPSCCASNQSQLSKINASSHHMKRFISLFAAILATLHKHFNHLSAIENARKYTICPLEILWSCHWCKFH